MSSQESRNARQDLVVLKQALHSTQDSDEKKRLLTQITQLCVDNFLHREGRTHAMELEKLLGIRPVPWVFSFPLSWGVCALFLCGLAPQKLVTFILQRFFIIDTLQITSDRLRAILYARYWYNIRQCATYSLIQFSVASNETEELVAIGTLAYTLVYTGHGGVALRTLRRVLSAAKRIQNETLIDTFSMHLGLAYQMVARPDEATKIYDDCDNRRPTSQKFFKAIRLVNRITLALMKRDLIAAEKAIDKCFGFSFALNENRNHIQIYGYKALLLAIEGKKDESLYFLDRSLASANANDNPLDHLICRRISLLTYLTLKMNNESAQTLIEANRFAHEYGWPLWYRIQFMGLSIFTRPSYALFSTTIKIGILSLFYLKAWPLRVWGGYFFQRILHPISFWRNDSILRYFRYRLETLQASTEYEVLRSIGDGVNRCLVESDTLSLEGFADQVRHTFKQSKVFIRNSIDELLEMIRETEVVNGFIGPTSSQDGIKVSCESGFFIGLSSPANKILRPFSVGLLVPRLSLLTETLTEAILRVILSNYVFLRTTHELQKRKIQDERTAAVAEVALQVAHDIRAPLAALMGIQDAPWDTTDGKKIHIQNAVTRIEEIANHLLQKNREWKAPEKTVPFHSASCGEILSPLLENVVEEKKLQYHSSEGLEIKLNVTGSVPEVFAQINQAEIKRIVSNLIDNSVEAIPGTGQICVSTWVDQNFVVVSISDTGRGIDPAHMSHLMKKGSTFGKNTGNGLALYHAKLAIESWGGTISIQSTPNLGTTVEIRLPREGVELDCVLIDDDILIRSLWEHSAQINAKKIRTFITPNEFWNCASQYHSQLPIFIDEHLGEQSGIEAAENLWKKGFANIYLTTGFPSSKVVAVSWLKGIIGKNPPWTTLGDKVSAQAEI